MLTAGRACGIVASFIGSPPYLVAGLVNKDHVATCKRGSRAAGSDNYLELMSSGSSQQSPSTKRPTLTSFRTGQSFLERLAVLYADQTRMTILTELYMREMSPKQFYETVGGTSYDSVRRHFVKLVETGWLRRVRTESSGRGRPEHLYRSTELAVIDDETWAQLPISIRDDFTVQLLEEMGRRLAAALDAETFGAREDHVSFASLTLDKTGWTEAIATVNRCFRSLIDEQTDSKIRLEKSGGTPILMVVELGGFETYPGTSKGPPSDLRPESPPVALGAWRERIAKVFADPVNLTIVNLLSDSAMSPSRLASVLDGVSVETCDRRCKMLERNGWIAKVEERTGGARRGATENFYRATSPALPRAELFGDLPEGVANTEAWGVFGEFCGQALEAVRTGTFNREPTRHLSLSTLLVDETGWSQVVALLRACARSLAGIERAVRHRVRNGAQPKPVGFFAAAFVSSLPQ